MKPLVECIPNFSEGRRMEVVEQIVDAIAQVSGVTVLDYSADADHNRSVVTFVGTPDGVEDAAFNMIQTAASLIDLDEHSGEHPRIGATDVVPFVPIRNVTMDDCVAMARRLGQRVGDELNVPVYLYEQAATRPDRVNLANLRKGEYEGLKEAVGTDPERIPDFGPAELGKAGATVIGARAPLIAYNVYLNTDDVEAANKIARSVRHSSGGLRFVKALGLLVEGQAQVSMNLTDYTSTPIHLVQETIRREAQRYGYAITHAELIGMIPEQALIDTSRWYLQLDLFNEDQILERKVAAAEASSLVPGNVLNAVASGDPTPGGGSVAALAGALSAGLAGMVARTTLGKKKYADVEDQMQHAADAADDLRMKLAENIDADAAAFDAVMNAYRMDKDDPARADAIQSAMHHAANVPLQTMRQSVDALEQLKIVAEKGNANAVIDAAAGAQMARAAVEAAAMNVLINAQELTDGDSAEALRDVANRLRIRAAEMLDEITDIAEQRSGLS